MSTDTLPKLTLPSSDRARLDRLVWSIAAERHPVTPFLMNEIRRAEVVPDGSAEIESFAVMNRWIKYRVDWGQPPETRKLVFPEDHRSSRREVSVLSPLGAALLGVRTGERMPYYETDGSFHLAMVESVSRSEPVLVPLFPATRDVRLPGEGFDDDPGPSAA